VTIGAYHWSAADQFIVRAEDLSPFLLERYAGLRVANLVVSEPVWGGWGSNCLAALDVQGHDR